MAWTHLGFGSLLGFGIGAVAMLTLAMGMIAPALLNRRAPRRDHSDQQNIRLARRRVEALDELDYAGAGESQEETRAEALAEIEMALLDDLGKQAANPPPKTPSAACTALIIALIPLFSMGMAVYLGNSPASALPADVSPAGDSSLDASSVEAMLEQLEKKLLANPSNADGWALAGRTYTALGQFEKAEHAFDTLLRLNGEDADVLVAWANAAVHANHGVFSEPIMQRIARAVERHPTHQGALWMSALGAESQGNYRAALTHLQQLARLVENNPQASAGVSGFMARITRLQRLSGAAD